MVALSAFLSVFLSVKVILLQFSSYRTRGLRLSLVAVVVVVFAVVVVAAVFAAVVVVVSVFVAAAVVVVVVVVVVEVVVVDHAVPAVVVAVLYQNLWQPVFAVLTNSGTWQLSFWQSDRDF